MEKLVRVYNTTLSLDHTRVINPDGKYVACMVHLSAKDGAPYTYLNFWLLDATFAPECRDKFLALMKFGGCLSEEFTDCIIGEVTGHTDVNGLITVNLDLKAKPTDTVGKNQYVVCLACGGEMGAPQYLYRDFQIISADSQKEAKDKYDEINHCTYFKGMCIGECHEIVNDRPFNPQRSHFDLVTNPVAPEVKVPTRSEYYESLGFSGSEFERPDDPIDDEFIKHCCGLKTIAEGFVDYCKQTAECVKDPSNIKEYHGISSNDGPSEREAGLTEKVYIPFKIHSDDSKDRSMELRSFIMKIASIGITSDKLMKWEQLSDKQKKLVNMDHLGSDSIHWSFIFNDSDTIGISIPIVLRTEILASDTIKVKKLYSNCFAFEVYPRIDKVDQIQDILGKIPILEDAADVVRRELVKKLDEEVLEYVNNDTSSENDDDLQVYLSNRKEPPLSKEEMEDVERIAHNLWADPVGKRAVNKIAKILRRVPDDQLKRACEALGNEDKVTHEPIEERPGFFERIAIWFDRIFSR